MRPIQALALALACTWSGAARADHDRWSESRPEPGLLNAADLGVLQHLRDVDLMEIAAAQVAEQRGTATVKRYAKQLRRDHENADRAVVRLVEDRGQELTAHKPATDGDKVAAMHHAELMARFATLDGAAFDRAYLDMMVVGHDKLAAYVNNAIIGVDDDDVRGLLLSIEPRITKHAQHARTLRASQED